MRRFLEPLSISRGTSTELHAVAGQGPLPLGWALGSPNKQHRQLSGHDAEQHHLDGETEAGELCPQDGGLELLALEFAIAPRVGHVVAPVV